MPVHSRPKQFTVTLSEHGTELLKRMQKDSGLTYSGVVDVALRKLEQGGEFDIAPPDPAHSLNNGK
jgi:hypothetical protein